MGTPPFIHIHFCSWSDHEIIKKLLAIDNSNSVCFAPFPSCSFTNVSTFSHKTAFLSSSGSQHYTAYMLLRFNRCISRLPPPKPGNHTPHQAMISTGQKASLISKGQNVRQPQNPGKLCCSTFGNHQQLWIAKPAPTLSGADQYSCWIQSVNQHALLCKLPATRRMTAWLSGQHFNWKIPCSLLIPILSVNAC